MGQREAVLQEAVSIRGGLAQARPDAFLPALAASLTNLGNVCARAGALEPDSLFLALRWAELAKARGDQAKAAQWAAEALQRQPIWDESQESVELGPGGGVGGRGVKGQETCTRLTKL